MSEVQIKNINPAGGHSVVVRATSAHPQPHSQPPVMLTPGEEAKFTVSPLVTVTVHDASGNNG